MKLYILFSIVFGTLLFFLGIYCSNKMENSKMKLPLSVFLLFITSPFLIFTFDVAFPLIVEFRTIPHIELVNVMWGFTFGFLRLKKKIFSNKLVWYIFSFSYLLLTIFFLLKPFSLQMIIPFNEKDYKNRWKNSVCIQSTGYSCSPAAIATLLKYYKIDKKEKDIAKLVLTDYKGTKTWNIIKFLRKNGFMVKYLLFRNIDQVPFPSIITMSYGILPHSVVYFGKKNGLYHLADPARGYLKLNKKMYKKTYSKFLGPVIHIEKVNFK